MLLHRWLPTISNHSTWQIMAMHLWKVWTSWIRVTSEQRVTDGNLALQRLCGKSISSLALTDLPEIVAHAKRNPSAELLRLARNSYCALSLYIYIYIWVTPLILGALCPFLWFFSPEISKKCPKKICLNLADFWGQCIYWTQKWHYFPCFEHIFRKMCLKQGKYT